MRRLCSQLSRADIGAKRAAGVADQLMPFVDWDLAGDDCRSAAVALLAEDSDRAR